MFGAPDLPRRATSKTRRPGVGDHVCHLGGYVGLIVEALPDNSFVVARRHAPGRFGVVETPESPAFCDRFQVAPHAPLGFDEVIDPDWRRGVLLG